MAKRTMRILSGLLVCIFVFTGCQIKYSEDVTSTDETTTVQEEKIINFAYYDDTYTAYFEYCKEAYEKTHKGVTVNLNLLGEDTYLETINQTTTDQSLIQDVYMLDNHDIGTAYLAGLAMKNTNVDFTTDHYCQVALDACSYNGNLVAYPLGYRTVFLAYNKSIVGSTDVSTFEAIKAFSTDADLSVKAASKVQTIFATNLTEIFMNYGFFGSAFSIGGQYGDDSSVFSVNNAKAIAASKEYLSLIDYFSINKKTSYATEVTNFLAGKSVLTLLSTDSLEKLEAAKIKYTLAAFPDYDDTVTTSPLSSTTALVVSPYSKNQEDAQDFAWFATYAKAVVLYEYTKQLSAKREIVYDNYGFENIYESYAKSTPKNKLLYGEQAYPLLEIALHNVIAGEDAATELENVDTYMLEQLQ